MVLEPLVVSAAGFEQRLIDAPASISVIAGPELLERRVITLADALREVEGINVDSRVGKTGAPNISIRGLPSDYTLILIDGRRQNVAGNITPNGFGEMATAFIPPVAAIEQIEVIRGPMSTLYGSDAMGGVVNIITKKVGDTWGGTISATTTQQENDDFGAVYGTGLYTSGPIVPGKLGLTLRGNYTHRQASAPTLPPGMVSDSELQSSRGFKRTEADFWNFGTRLNWIVGENHDIWFDADWGRQVHDNSNGELGNVFGTSATANYKDELRFNRDQYAIGWTGRFGAGTLTTSLMYNESENIGRVIGTALGTNPFVQPGDNWILTNENIIFDAKFVAPIGDSHNLTIGTQYWDAEMITGITTDVTTGELKPFKGEQISLFAEDAWKLTDDLTLTLGLRYDDHDKVGDNFSPRAYAVWHALPEWTIKGGISKGFKTPALNAFHNGINSVGSQGATIGYGDPNLKPETSTSYELGVVYDDQRAFSAGATVFFTDFSNKIGNTTWGPIDPLTQLPIWVRTGNYDAESHGVESFLSWDFAERWTLSANYTWTKTKNKETDLSLTSTPEHSANLRLTWRATNRFTFWTSAEYRGESERNTNAAAVAALGDFEAYELFHLGMNWKASDTLTLHFTVNNLLDKDFNDFAAITATAYANRYANINEGRRLTVSATLSF